MLKLIHIASVSAVIGLTSQAAMAQTYAYVNASAGGWHEGDVNQLNAFGSVRASVDERGDGISRAGHDGLPYATTATAYASIEPGVLKVSGSGTYSGAVSSVSGSQASFSDTLFIQGPKDFEVALLHYKIRVKGALSVNSTAYSSGEFPPASANWSLSHHMSGVGYKDLNLYSLVEKDSTGEMGITATVNGEPGNLYGDHVLIAQVPLNGTAYLSFDVYGYQRLDGWGGSGSSGSASYDLGNSIYWGGISQVTTLDGTPLNVTISSSSGTDYFKSYIPAVPEPSSVFLAMAGVAVLLITLRGASARSSTKTKKDLSIWKRIPPTLASAAFSLTGNAALAYSSVDTRILLGGSVAVMESDNHSAESIWESDVPELQTGRASGSTHGGVLKAYAELSSQAISLLDAHATTRLIDELTIVDEARTGKKGMVKLGFALSWSLSGLSFYDYGVARPVATFGIVIDRGIGAHQVKFESHDITRSDTNSVQAFVDRNGQSLPWGSPFQFDYEFTFGAPFTLDVILDVQASLSGAGNAVADASHSAYWSGISSVTVDGNRITDFVVTSQSGTDWAKSYIPAVPEPASIALLLAGVSTVAFATKRTQPAPC